MSQTTVNVKKPSAVPSPTLESLPKQFVTAMRTLFDIMDDKQTGYVNFADIEHRWQDDGTKGVPKGVIESLQKVTPPSGMLSFERFCAGLKICLLRNEGDKQVKPRVENRPPSAPLLDIETPKAPTYNPANTATVRPTISQQRTHSMPQLLIEKGAPEKLEPRQEPKPLIQQNKQLYGPPKPPRVGLIDKSEIRTALQNWQMGVMIDQEHKDKRTTSNGILAPSNGQTQVWTGRGAGDGKPAPQNDLKIALHQKKVNVRKREPRRHTLQNGIDYNMLKKMKQIEQEKDVLMQGLSAIEKARDWYLKQVNAVQDKMKYLGRMGSHMEQWSEAQQERLELQRARVLEVNRHLATLTCSWERGGLPLHMNLAVHHLPSSVTNLHQRQENIVNRLKQQNHLLTEEVGKKSERIAVLEREKATLIRELLQVRAQPRNNPQQQEEAVF